MIASAREVILPTLAALWGESYSRAYKTLVSVQVRPALDLISN